MPTARPKPLKGTRLECDGVVPNSFSRNIIREGAILMKLFQIGLQQTLGIVVYLVSEIRPRVNLMV